VLEVSQFHVVTAASVSGVLHLIAQEPFDVLLCEHMPGAGDGFTVVSAMRHKNPDAVTLVFTGYPALEQAMNAIMLQADSMPGNPSAVYAVREEAVRQRAYEIYEERGRQEGRAED
jgi:ActR/RegA family two-component response regulator